MEKTISITIHQLPAEKRLDQYLTANLPGVSRSMVKKMIEGNNVKINSQIEYRANYRLKEGDVIDIDSKNLIDIKSGNILQPENIPLNIIYEDEDMLAVHKPCGMVVHPADGNWTGTLMNAVLYHYSDQNEIGRNSFRGGLIHRLDKETSGIVLIGKTPLGLFHYTKLFADRKLSKYYIVLAEGPLSVLNKIPAECVVENMLGRNPLNRKKVRSFRIGGGMPEFSVRVARTKFYKIANNSKGYVIFIAKPETGRTHQIRVHIKDLGLEIVGDRIYGSGEKSGERMMLHAYAIVLNRPSKERITIKANPDSQFANILRAKGFDLNEVMTKLEKFII